MKSYKWSLLEVLLISLICGSVSYGKLFLDQSCEASELGAGYGVEQNLWSWQEFRPAMDNVEQVDFYFESWNVPSGVTVFFQIRDGRSILWSTSFSADLIGEGMGWFEIDTPYIPLIPDHSYKLYLTSNLTFEQVWNGAMLMWPIEDNTYSRGISSVGSDVDFNFRTWAIPEPAALSLLAFGGLALLRKRK